MSEPPAQALLVQQAAQAVRQGRAAAALELLGRAEALAPDDVSVHLYKSLAPERHRRLEAGRRAALSHVLRHAAVGHSPGPRGGLHVAGLR